MRHSTRKRLVLLEHDIAALKQLAASSQTDASRLRRMTGKVLDGRTHAGDASTLDAVERIFTP